ncbi:hypothetical protein [Cohnella lupini]|uniref:Uncharacterized protein n=1 Tax=Cohnella lupini TaxID=1294267 RepID=A0A3D9I4U8_9BACL|nr:hypothetical protein [Cohnella lupini]RED56774.1 hypothetical protein DFP95_11265 [Cohnella lupini]
MSVNGEISRRTAHPSFAHLRRLTDDTGLLEHALGRIPRRREGYTTDDNARALWTVTEWLSFPTGTLDSEERSELNRLADIYLAFMLWAQENDGWFLNNFAYDRTLEPEEVSHDCQGRSLWACADAWIRLEGPHRETARVIFERSLPTLARIDSLRGQAFAMAACAHLLGAAKNGQIDLPHDMEGDIRHHLNRLEQLLNGAFRHFTDGNWRWFEPAMTYSNGILPWAMLRTYRYTQKPETLRTGLESLSYLLEVMSTDEGWLRPIGNDGWCTSDSTNVSLWDQQPLEMFKLALALEEAALATELADRDQSARLVGSARSKSSADSYSERGTFERPAVLGRSGLSSGNPAHYRALRDQCRDWYYGENDHRVPVVDPADGSCCDGLTPFGPNINCGAEATISYLMTEALCRRV